MATVEVVGWHPWHDFSKEDCPVDTYQDYIDATVRYLRRSQIKRSGYWHQYAEEGAPLFSDGKVLRCSLREWGGIMWEAHHPEDPDPYGYCEYAWGCKEDDKSDIERPRYPFVSQRST